MSFPSTMSYFSLSCVSNLRRSASFYWRYFYTAVWYFLSFSLMAFNVNSSSFEICLSSSLIPLVAMSMPSKYSVTYRGSWDLSNSISPSATAFLSLAYCPGDTSLSRGNSFVCGAYFGSSYLSSEACRIALPTTVLWRVNIYFIAYAQIKNYF